MKADFKQYLMSLLKLRHRHPDPVTKQPSMSEALKCNECGERFKKAEAVYNQRRREHPEEFMRTQPEFIPSPQARKDFEMLIDRVKNDELYRRHVQRLAWGTEEEKDEEIKKANEGYYDTHYTEKGGSIKEIPKDTKN